MESTREGTNEEGAEGPVVVQRVYWQILETFAQYSIVAHGWEDHICGCRLVGQNGHCIAKSELERLQRAAYIMITGAMRTTPTKVLEMLLDRPTLGMAVEFAALMAANDLGTGHNRI